MDAETKRWNPPDDSGPGPHRYASVGAPTDRQVFTVSKEAWEKLQEVLRRPEAAKPNIAALLAEDSTLESGQVSL